MYDYTPDQIDLFVRAAINRRNEELLSQANVVAAGSATGFSGNTKPLEALEKAVRGKVVAKGLRGELQNRLKKFAGSSVLKVKDLGPNRR